MQRASLPGLAATRFDVLVIGGGIYGAMAAREAALRGPSTALIERGDWGAGTSCNSLKIVHGGIRYVQPPGCAPRPASGPSGRPPRPGTGA